MIICQICSLERLQITAKHLAQHGMSMLDYRAKFPDAPLQDESIIMRGENNPFFGKHHTEELKQWQREHFTGKKCPEASKKISEKWKDANGVYRKMMASVEYRQIMSNATQHYWDSSISDEHRKKNADSFRERRPSFSQKLKIIFEDPIHRKNISERMKHMWKTTTPEEKDARIQKSISTMMTNGGGNLSSKGEIEFFELLKSKWSKTKHGYWIPKSITSSKSNWNVDFYIPEMDVYVQFDGVYWHGLDRPINVIMESQSLRDQIIYKKYLLDKEQDVWFQKQEKCLVRITDIQFKEDPELCIQIVECKGKIKWEA